ncbi:MAG: helix-turn-helix domain-containing protein [Clostridiales bacterium]|nr:helix-turn-helix domain-containing protein [Clostridiales bacterium]
MQDEINKQIAKRLLQLIKNSNMKTSDLAKAASVSTSNLYSILRGDTMPALYTLFMLCKGLQIPLSSFFIGIEIEEGSRLAIGDISIDGKIKTLPPKNYRILMEMVDILLKYP